MKKFETLDAMRGVAAVAVVLFHAREMLPVAPSGYLAVDLFFVLSGFVIAHAYDERMESLGLGGFLRVRLVRLYPLFLLGALLAAARGLALLVKGDPEIPSGGMLAAYVGLGLLFLPAPFGHLFLNSPAWSLMYEVAANIVYAVVHRLLTTRVLIGIVAAGFAGLLVTSFRHDGLHAGFLWPQFFEGFSRVTFSFFLGVLLYRWREKVAVPQVPPLVLLGLLAVALALPVRSALHDLAFVVFLSPALVLLGAAAKPAPGSAYLGEISYPMYAVHHPLIGAAALASHMTGTPGALWALALVAGLLIACPVMARLYDAPARRWLTRPARLSAPA